MHLWLNSYGVQYYRSYRPHKNCKNLKKLNSSAWPCRQSALYVYILVTSYGILNVSEAATVRCSTKELFSKLVETLANYLFQSINKLTG